MTWERFFELEHRAGVRRTLMVAGAFWITYRATDWAFAFGYAVLQAKLDAAGIGGAALLVGAITAPVAYLQRAAFGDYFGAKRGDGPPAGQ